MTEQIMQSTVVLNHDICLNSEESLKKTGFFSYLSGIDHDHDDRLFAFDHGRNEYLGYKLLVKFGLTNFDQRNRGQHPLPHQISIAAAVAFCTSIFICKTCFKLDKL